MVGEGGTSQLILKRLYHSSETRRFLGAERGTKVGEGESEIYHKRKDSFYVFK